LTHREFPESLTGFGFAVNDFIRNKFVLRKHLLGKDKELLALRNNFRATKKFLIAKFDFYTT
jgi:hypothetical protein